MTMGGQSIGSMEVHGVTKSQIDLVTKEQPQRAGIQLIQRVEQERIAVSIGSTRRSEKKHESNLAFLILSSQLTELAGVNRRLSVILLATHPTSSLRL